MQSSKRWETIDCALRISVWECWCGECVFCMCCGLHALNPQPVAQVYSETGRSSVEILLGEFSLHSSELCISVMMLQTKRFLSMRSFYESGFLFTTHCSSPNVAIAFNVLFLWEHSLCAPGGAERQWAAHGENSGNGRTYTRRDPNFSALFWRFSAFFNS